jgi:cysteinyl-tRNA synthetase
MVEGEKMSKSLGNFITIHELLRTDRFGGRSWPGDVLRLAMLKTHYRKPIDWTVKGLEEAEATLMRFSALVDIVEGTGAPDVKDPDSNALGEDLLSALADDLNLPAAMAHLHRLYRVAHDGETVTVRESAARQLIADTRFLGIDIVDFRRRRHERHEEHKRRASIEQALVETLVTERLAARKAKDWKRSDELRDELAAMGIAVKDGKDAAGELVTTWELKS